MNSKAVARYRTTPRGRQTHRDGNAQYHDTAKGMLTAVRRNATQRKGSL